MTLLIASITRAPAEVLRAHLQTVEWQNAGVDIDVCYYVDPDAPDETRETLEAHDVEVREAGPKPDDARYVVSDVTHNWSTETFHWLAEEKQKILDRARDEHYDAVWLVDSDLLLAPDTLSSLLSTRKDLVSAVFWTKWTPEQPPLPQVWLKHPYGFNAAGKSQTEFLSELLDRKLVKVRGLGACTLIREAVYDRVGYWPLLPDLPEEGGMWQGEDRHFSIRAERNHVEMWADSWADVFHCYRPKDTERIEEHLDQFKSASEAPETISPYPGMLLSFSIEPLEEPKLANHTEFVRGRLGQLKLLDDIEQALQEMHIGDERIIQAYFPPNFPIDGYRDSHKTFRLRLFGAKPHRLPPSVE